MVDCYVYMVTGDNAGLHRRITAVASETSLTVAAFPNNIASGDYYVISPVIFEMTVLFGALSAFVGMLAFNRLPQFYHPVFKSERFRRASSDRFFISVEAGDPLFDARAPRTCSNPWAASPWKAWRISRCRAG